jgi:outer membrane receptor protein involved in Fe transport
VEFDGAINPVTPLTFGVALTWLDPKFDSFVQSPFGDASGRRPAGIPSFSGTLSGDWDQALGNGDHLIFHADFHHEAPVQIVDGLPGFITTDPLTGLPTQAGYEIGLLAAQDLRREVNEVNASITYAMRSGLEFSLWARNLTDDRYLYTVFDSPAQPGSVSGYPNQPRSWGGAVRWRW